MDGHDLNIFCKIIFRKYTLNCDLKHQIRFYNDFQFEILTHISMNHVESDDSMKLFKDDFVKIEIDIEDLFWIPFYDIRIKGSQSLKVFSIYNDQVNNIEIEMNLFIMDISLKENKCMESVKGIFNTDFRTECCDKYRRKYFNEIYGCIPINNMIYQSLDLFDGNRYKLCSNDQETNISQEDESLDYCRKNCHVLRDCKVPFFDVFHYRSGQLKNHKTQINIILKKGDDFDYIEKQRFSLNDMFYNCGDIVGMWLGWSIASISNFLIVLKTIKKCLISNMNNFFKYIEIMILKNRFIQKIWSKIHSNLSRFEFQLRTLVFLNFFCFCLFNVYSKTCLVIESNSKKISEIVIKVSKFIFYTIIHFSLLITLNTISSIFKTGFNCFKCLSIYFQNLLKFFKRLPRQILCKAINFKNYILNI